MQEIYQEKDYSTRGTDLDSLARLTNETDSTLKKQASLLLVNADTDGVVRVNDTTRSVDKSNTIVASYKNYYLHSAFQPIFSISHRCPVGYEGLIRAQTAEMLPPFSTRSFFRGRNE